LETSPIELQTIEAAAETDVVAWRHQGQRFSAFDSTRRRSYAKHGFFD
jgi:hypothetical protein